MRYIEVSVLCKINLDEVFEKLMRNEIEHFPLFWKVKEKDFSINFFF